MLVNICCLVIITLECIVFTEGTFKNTEQLSFNPEKHIESFSSAIEAAEKNSSGVAHSRRRRYVVFPDGSSFLLGICLTTFVYDPIFTQSINYFLTFDLPNETMHQTTERMKDMPGNRRKTENKILYRQKRSIYHAFETLLSSAGFSGRDCILRAICESTQRLAPRQGVINEIIRLIFSYPIRKAVDKLRPGRHREYGLANFVGQSQENCFKFFPCPLSILNLMLLGNNIEN